MLRVSALFAQYIYFVALYLVCLVHFLTLLSSFFFFCLLTEGDRAKAVKMLADPDALMEFPEVVAALEAADIAGDEEDTEEWEQSGGGYIANCSFA